MTVLENHLSCEVCGDLLQDLATVIGTHDKAKARLCAMPASSTASDYRQQMDAVYDAATQADLVRQSLERHCLEDHGRMMTMQNRARQLDAA